MKKYITLEQLLARGWAEDKIQFFLKAYSSKKFGRLGEDVYDELEVSNAEIFLRSKNINYGK